MAGRACWTYRGTATTFVGDFSHGQRIAAQMIGQAAEADPSSGRIIISWRPRDPYVEGPGGFFFSGAQAPGDLTFVARRMEPTASAFRLVRCGARRGW